MENNRCHVSNYDVCHCSVSQSTRISEASHCIIHLEISSRRKHVSSGLGA